MPRREDAELVADPGIDSKGYRIVRTEEAVFAAHPRAAHFRYPTSTDPISRCHANGWSCAASSTAGTG